MSHEKASLMADAHELDVHYEQLPLSVRCARLTGVISAAFVAGYAASNTATPKLTKVMEFLMTPLGLLSASCFLHLMLVAYKTPECLAKTPLDPKRSILCCGAAVACLFGSIMFPGGAVGVLSLIAAVVGMYAIVGDYHFTSCSPKHPDC